MPPHCAVVYGVFFVIIMPALMTLTVKRLIIGKAGLVNTNIKQTFKHGHYNFSILQLRTQCETFNIECPIFVTYGSSFGFLPIC